MSGPGAGGQFCSASRASGAATSDRSSRTTPSRNEEATAWVVRVLRPIPGLAWVPFAIIWFGVDLRAAVFIIATGVFWILFFAAHGAIRGVDRDLVEVAETFGFRSPLARLVKVLFPSFSDGRGFTLGRLIRDAGYTGRLRASGPIIADQYGMARRSGFDEVEIPEDLAARQGEAQWLARADWRDWDHRSRLAG